MDTTTVNYAINKLTEGWQKVAPQVADVTQKYVDFVVMKTVILPFIWVVVLVASIILLKKVTLKMVEKIDDEDIFIPFTVITAVTFGLGMLVGIGGILVDGYNAILALTCPEMFTIHQILNK